MPLALCVSSSFNCVRYFFLVIRWKMEMNWHMTVLLMKCTMLWVTCFLWMHVVEWQSGYCRRLLQCRFQQLQFIPLHCLHAFKYLLSPMYMNFLIQNFRIVVSGQKVTEECSPHSNKKFSSSCHQNLARKFRCQMKTFLVLSLHSWKTKLPEPWGRRYLLAYTMP